MKYIVTYELIGQMEVEAEDEFKAMNKVNNASLEDIMANAERWYALDNVEEVEDDE